MTDDSAANADCLVLGQRRSEDLAPLARPRAVRSRSTRRSGRAKLGSRNDLYWLRVYAYDVFGEQQVPGLSVSSLAVDSEWVLVDEFRLKSWGATETPLTLTTGFRPSDDLETTAWSLRDRSWRVQSTWPPCLVEISGCIAKPPRETAIIVLPGLAKKLITCYGTCPGDDHLHSHS